MGNSRSSRVKSPEEHAEESRQRLLKESWRLAEKSQDRIHQPTTEHPTNARADERPETTATTTATLLFVRVTMETLEDNDIRLWIDLRQTVRELKKALSLRIEYEWEKWTIQYCGKNLDDDSTLASYRMSKRDQLIAVTSKQLRAGASTKTWVRVVIDDRDDVILLLDPSSTVANLQQRFERWRPDIPMDDRVFAVNGTRLLDPRLTLDDHGVGSKGEVQLVKTKDDGSSTFRSRRDTHLLDHQILLDQFQFSNSEEKETDRVEVVVHLTKSCFFSYRGRCVFPLQRLYDKIQEKYGLPSESFRLNYGTAKNGDTIEITNQATFSDAKEILESAGDANDQRLCWTNQDGALELEAYLDLKASSPNIRVFCLAFRGNTYYIPCFPEQGIRDLCRALPTFMKDDSDLPDELKFDEEDQNENAMRRAFEDGVFLCGQRICNSDGTVESEDVKDDSRVVIVPNNEGGDMLRLIEELEQHVPSTTQTMTDAIIFPTDFSVEDRAAHRAGVEKVVRVIGQHESYFPLDKAEVDDLLAVRLMCIPLVRNMLNDALQAGPLIPERRNFLAALTRGVRSMPKYRKRMYVWRSMDSGRPLTVPDSTERETSTEQPTSVTQELDPHEVGTVVCEKRAVYGTKHLDLMHRIGHIEPGGFLYVIKAQNAVDMAIQYIVEKTQQTVKKAETCLATNPEEQPVLLLPYSFLEVTRVLSQDAPLTDEEMKEEEWSWMSELDRSLFSQVVVLKQINFPRTRKFVVWVDDNPDNNIKYVAEQERLGHCVILFTNTDDTTDFLWRYNWILDMEQSEVRLVTDRARDNEPAGDEAGLELIRRLRHDFHCAHRIMMFLGDAPRAEASLVEQDLADNVFVTASESGIRHFLDFEHPFQMPDVKTKWMRRNAPPQQLPPQPPPPTQPST